LILGVVAALGFGGGGFYAAYSGLLAGILGGSGGEAADAGSVAKGGHGEDNATASADKGHGATDEAHGTGGSSATAAFVEIDPLIVSLGSGRDLTHLRFRAHLEIVAGAEETVLSLMPRVMDVLNGYLRAMKPEELADPTMLIRLRAQMLRRVQLVVGEGLVKDLLVAEFVLN
jgi:flagellar FliL protein